MLKVLFRVDGHSTIGLGHLMRCMALSQCLSKHRHEVIFIVSATSLQYCQSRSDGYGRLLVIPDINKDAEPQWLYRQCLQHDVDWLILDGYQFDQHYRLQLLSKEFNLGVFDDTNSSGALQVDLVINGAGNAPALNYQNTAPSALLGIGNDYRILRQEFLHLTDRKWSERKCLTLMFGGSDPTNFTLSVLKSLEKVSVTMPIVMITGAAYPELLALEQFIESSELHIQHLHDCQNMAQIMCKTRLAISAAGGSQFELLSCATPSMLVVMAENQRLASQSAAQQGWCQVIDNEVISADELVQKSLKLWEQSALLLKMHERALVYKTSDGAKRILNLMQQKTFAKKRISGQ